MVKRTTITVMIRLRMMIISTMIPVIIIRRPIAVARARLDLQTLRTPICKLPLHQSSSHKCCWQPKGALDKNKRRHRTRQKALDKKHSTMRPGLGPRALDRFFFSPSSCRVLAFPQALLDDRYHLNYNSYQVAWPLNRSMIDPPNMWLLLICGCI